MNLRQIQEFWVNAGESFPKNSAITPTSRDPYLAQLERQHILRFLTSDMDVLEVGCGDGAHTAEYARRCRSIRGHDISPGLVDVARQRAREQGRANATFSCGSVLDVQRDLSGQTFDCVISQRCLINLPDWQHQRQAIEGLAAMLKSHGLLVLTEGFAEPLEELNHVRTEHGLDAIKVVEYNRNLVVAEFEPVIGRTFEIMDILDYGFYLFVSRVLHPLAVAPQAPKHDGPINRAALDLVKAVPATAFRKFSYNLCYVLRKRTGA
jgi:2-polyprenyl-3-methyl-5-hydroxy-6-metoxy-1,4-benzoquinol methylase